MPKFQIAPRRNHEAGMVEPGHGFGEETAVIVVVPVQGKHQLPVASRENSPNATGMRDIEDGMNIEDSFVPSDARLEIGDGDREMVQARLAVGMGHTRRFYPEAEELLAAWGSAPS